MTMDIECEEPKEKCESLAEQAEETATFEIPDKELLAKVRRRLRRYMPSFIEFFLLNYLDVYHPKAKENVWWDVYPQDKEIVKKALEEETHE